MKPVLNFIKQNPFIIIFSVIIILVLPAAFFVSSWWGGKIRAAQAKAAGDAFTQVNAARLDYAIPSYEPGSQPVVHKAEPNLQLVEWFQAQRNTLAQQATELVARANAFNQGIGPDAAAVFRTEHKPLVAGLFPKPAPGEETEKLNQMEDRLLGKRGNPNLYQAMLDAIGAGGPADPVRIAESIRDMQVRETEKVTSSKRELTAEEATKLTAALTDRRLAEYRARASQISVYADLDSLPSDPRQGRAIPRDRIDARMINTVEFYIFQWDQWVLKDLLTAVKVANAGSSGTPLSVDQAPVKRIEKITMADPDGFFASTEPMGADGMGAVPPTASAPGMVPTDPQISITGRGSGSWNTMYDIRRAKLTLVVSSARVADVLNAISRTNFMSVTDLDLEEVDIAADMRQGYYYGGEHVVRANISVETVWLRSWMEPLMPDRIRALLGLPERQPEANPDGTTPEAPPGAS